MYWIQNSGNGHNAAWKRFYCDTGDDITALPTMTDKGSEDKCVDDTDREICAIGSECISLGEGKLYVLNSENSWEVFGLTTE